MKVDPFCAHNWITGNFILEMFAPTITLPNLAYKMQDLQLIMDFRKYLSSIYLPTKSIFSMYHAISGTHLLKIKWASFFIWQS